MSTLAKRIVFNIPCCISFSSPGLMSQSPKFLHSLKISTLTFLLPVMLASGSMAQADEVFGPAKPKVVPTPFSVGEAKEEKLPSDSLASVGLTTNSDTPLIGRRSIGDRLGSSRLYLPDKMVLGRVSEFTVKGLPGKWVALAMAEKNTGAKPIFGHELRLGSDRKVVATSKIPESGVATLLVECPIEGDLVGSNLYFEAVVWPEGRPQEMEMATCVPAKTNSVLIEGQLDTKKGLMIKPTTTSPFSGGTSQPGLSSPQP
ncbi:MAG TPA: hypothetical protein V6C86_09480 [Oculatellaceae cyanobacterium]